MRRIPFVAVMAMALFARISFGQVTSADLVGIVRDPSVAIVSNANVTVTNQATGAVVSVKSGSDGEFRATNLTTTFSTEELASLPTARWVSALSTRHCSASAPVSP
jgi:hypothetical protein